MPQLVAHSTPTLIPLPQSLLNAALPDDPPPPDAQPAFPVDAHVAAASPAIDPVSWEDFAVFRETFLMYVTPPGYAAALRKVGEMLFTMTLESYNPWPGWPESSTRTELRAAVADLRHLQ